MEYTKKGTSLLYGDTINNASTITTSSTESSIDTAANESINMSFLFMNKSILQHLMEDISIIDNVYKTFEVQNDLDTYDSQILKKEIRTNIKQRTLHDLIQSEINYVNELFEFEKLYTSGIQYWLNNTHAKTLASQNKRDLELLLHNIHNIAIVHTNFIKRLKNRVQIWGPTQLISDVFCGMYDDLTVYDSFLKHHLKFVMAFDSLFKIPSFVKQLESLVQDKSFNLDNHNNIIYYLQIPLHRVSLLSEVVCKLVQNSDPATPDYSHLSKISDKYIQFEEKMFTKSRDAQTHLSVLEALLKIEGCPITVTPERRLLQSARLIKVDLDNITSKADVRMYLLYNDALIYCKIQKDKRDRPREQKLVYKGTLNLKGAEIRQLAPSFCAKMCEVKKPLFRLGKKNSQTDSSSQSDIEAFGFELVATEANLDAMSPMHQNYQTAIAGAGNLLLRRHVLRTNSQRQQKLWFDNIREAIIKANKQDE